MPTIRLMNTSAMQTGTAAHEGAEACFAGKFTCDNPYPFGSRSHKAWEAGWLNAMEVRMEWEEDNDARALGVGDDS